MKTESMSVKTAMVCLLVVLITSCSEKKEYQSRTLRILSVPAET